MINITLEPLRLNVRITDKRSIIYVLTKTIRNEINEN